jgi:N-acetylneuraminic acid mutarotase
VTGGETNQLESLNSVYVYDPQADAWTQLANMSNARRFHASAAVGSKLYVFGGRRGASGPLDTAEVYDPALDSWAQESSLTSARNEMVAIAL